MANAINTVKALTTIAAKVGAQMFRNELGFVSSVDKEDENTYGMNFRSVQPGDTININKPARFTLRTDATYSAQDITEEKVALAVDQRRGVDVALTSAEIATDLAREAWAKRVLKPAVQRLAEGVENYCLTAAEQAVYQMVGTPGTSPATSTVFLQAKEKIVRQASPVNDKFLAAINPGVTTTMVPALQGLMNPQSAVGEQYLKGRMGTAFNMDFYESNLLWSFTTGTQAGYASALSNGATQSGATIAIDGMTGSATIKKGTVVTFSGVYDVNPITKDTLPNLKQFVVTADVTLSGGAGNLSISPALVATGTTQNASSTIADGSTVTFDSGTAASTTYGQSLVYHPSAFRFCSLPLFNPEQGVVESHTETVDGISIRALTFYDGSSDQLKLRLDTQFGFAAVRPEWAARVTS